MSVDLRPGNVIKYDIYEPHYGRHCATKVFEVKAVDGNKLYGTELQNINSIVEEGCSSSEKPKFEVIA